MVDFLVNSLKELSDSDLNYIKKMIEIEQEERAEEEF